MTMKRLSNKVAIVTGASSGIGAAVAVAFAQDGARLVVTGRNKRRLAEVAQRCRDLGAEVLQVVADLSTFEELEPLIKKAVENFSEIHILLNNAGYSWWGPVQNVSLKLYESLFETNLRASMFLSKYALPHLKKTKGCIINVSSTVGISCLPNVVIYGMAKAALIHFTKGLAAETAMDGVRVNAISPGLVDTSIWEVVPKGRQVLEKALEKQPLGIIQPEDCAQAILFLCISTHITGANLVVDGGVLLPL